jgi:hypothetical protein
MSHYGGRLRLIASLHDPAVIRKILAHLGIAQGRTPAPSHLSQTPLRSDVILDGAVPPSCLRGEAPSALIRPVHVAG